MFIDLIGASELSQRVDGQLELPHHLADGGLHPVQRVPRGTEAARLRNGHKCL